MSGDDPRFADTAVTQVLDDFGPTLRPVVVPAGERLFEQGDDADCAWLIEEGTVALEMRVPGGADVEVTTVGPGALLGEPALLERGTRMLSATATTVLAARVIDRVDFQGLLHAYQPSSFLLLRRIATVCAQRLLTDLPPPAKRPARPPGAQPVSFDPLPFLPHLPFFERLTSDDAETLLRRGVCWEAPRGETLIAQGDGPGAVHVVLRGAVEILRPGGGGRLALVGPGQTVGGVGSLLGTGATAEVRVREDAALLTFTEGVLTALLQPDDRLSFRFLDALTRDLLGALARTNRGSARDALTRRIS